MPAITKELKSEEEWLNQSREQKALHFCSYFAHMRKDYRLGGLVGSFLLLRGGSLEEEVESLLVEEVCKSLDQFETQEQVFMKSALELLTLIGPT